VNTAEIIENHFYWPLACSCHCGEEFEGREDHARHVVELLAECEGCNCS
jgi:hypothetical protein